MLGVDGGSERRSWGLGIRDLGLEIRDWGVGIRMRERLQPRALPWPLPLRRQGEAGRGCSRLALIRQAPLPNPSAPPAHLACVHWRANQWFANAPPHPLPSQGRGQKIAASAATPTVRLTRRRRAAAPA